MPLLKWEDQGHNDLAIHVWTPAGLGGVYGHVAAVLSQPGVAPEQPQPQAQPAETPTASRLVADFSKNAKSLNKFCRAKRTSYFSKNAPYDQARFQLRGGAYVFSRESFGPGVYHVRFVLNESDKKFRYHFPAFAFYVQDAAAADGKNDVANLHEHLELTWRSGQCIFAYQPPPVAQGQRAEQRRLGFCQLPGPDSPAAQKADEALDLTLVVPEPGGELKVYFRRERPEGEPHCTFKMPVEPRAGSFGLINHKWFSHVYLERLEYAPAS